LLDIKNLKFYWLKKSGGLRFIIVQNFVKICQSIVEILRFFIFQNGGRSPPWIFKTLRFYWPMRSKGSKCIIMPNFVEIGRTVFEISRGAMEDVGGSVIMEIGEAIKNPAYRIFQTEYSGCLDISAHA